MSDDQKKPEEKAQPQDSMAQEKPAAKKAKEMTRDKDGKPKAIKGPIRLTCAPECVGGFHDGERNLRIPVAGDNPVEVSEIRAGSWLWCQMDAGLIIQVG